MTSLGARIVGSSVWAAVETWGRQALMIAVFVIVARYLGPEAFGLAALAMVVPIVLAVPVTQGVPEALIQRAEVQPIHFDSAFWLLTVSGTLLAALIWLLAGTIATAFGQPSLADLVRW